MELQARIAQLAELLCSYCMCLTELTYEYGPYDSDAPEEGWELHLSESCAEMVGGADDGAGVYSGIVADISGMLTLFDAGAAPIVTLLNDLQRPSHVVIEGSYQNCPVTIHIYTEPRLDTPEINVDASGRIWHRPEADTTE